MSALDDAYDAYIRQIFSQMMQNITGGEAMQPALEKFERTATLAKLMKSRAEAILAKPENVEALEIVDVAPIVEARPTRRRRTKPS